MVEIGDGRRSSMKNLVADRDTRSVRRSSDVVDLNLSMSFKARPSRQLSMLSQSQMMSPSDIKTNYKAEENEKFKLSLLSKFTKL